MTDDGDPIPWKVATHITDFGSPKLKTVERAYFGTARPCCHSHAVRR